MVSRLRRWRLSQRFLNVLTIWCQLIVQFDSVFLTIAYRHVLVKESRSQMYVDAVASVDTTLYLAQMLHSAAFYSEGHLLNQRNGEHHKERERREHCKSVRRHSREYLPLCWHA